MQLKLVATTLFFMYLPIFNFSQFFERFNGSFEEVVIRKEFLLRRFVGVFLVLWEIGVVLDMILHNLMSGRRSC